MSLKDFCVPGKVVNHTRISRRFQQFPDTLRAKPCHRQRSALEQFSYFQVSLSPSKCISSCSSDDVIKFLISIKDSSGRTVVCSQLCPKVSSNCPTRLAVGTVDSLLGKHKDILNNIGRSHDSNPVPGGQGKCMLWNPPPLTCFWGQHQVSGGFLVILVRMNSILSVRYFLCDLLGIVKNLAQKV